MPDRSIAGPLQRQNAPAHPLQKPARTFEDETGQYMPIPQLRKTVAENRRVKRLGKTGARVLTIRLREMTGKRTEAPRSGGASVFLQLFSRSWGWLHRYRRRTSPKILTKMGHFPVSRSNLSKNDRFQADPSLTLSTNESHAIWTKATRTIPRTMFNIGHHSGPGRCRV